MEVIRDKEKMREWSRGRRRNGERVALVPTMGFLHAGHLSLVKEAKALAERVVVSVYVNPAQFSPGEDLATYPRDFEGDLLRLQPLEVDVVFHPYDLYHREDAINNDDSKVQGISAAASGHETWIRTERLEKPMCGQSRPIFFRGVATAVAKLFNIVEPDIAIFGKKDFQQWRVICRMVRDLDFGVQIIGLPLIREPDGLAMSSRNIHLSSADRQKVNWWTETLRTCFNGCLNEFDCGLMWQALSISWSLKEAKKRVADGEVDCKFLNELVREAIGQAGGRVDYVELVDQESLQTMTEVNVSAVLAVAAWFGKVRLLDNIELQPSSSR